MSTNGPNDDRNDLPGSRTDYLGTQQEGTERAASSFGDWRDQNVFDVLEPEVLVNPRCLRKLYRQKSDVIDDRKIRNRIKRLVEAGPFTSEGFQKWRYTGQEGSGGANTDG